MAAAKRSTAKKKRSKGDGALAWTVTLLGGLLLVVVGFSSGVLMGVMTEEPELVTGHLAGRSEEVPWTVAAEADSFGDSAAQLASAVVDAVTEPLVAATDDAAPTLPPVAAAGPAAQQAPVPPAPVATAPKPRRALPVVAAPPPTGFAVQVGAFSSSEAARAMMAKLDTHGYKSYVAAGAAGRDGRWRVRIGPFATREAADVEAAKLKRDQKLPTWVLSEEG